MLGDSPPTLRGFRVDYIVTNGLGWDEHFILRANLYERGEETRGLVAPLLQFQLEIIDRHSHRCCRLGGRTTFSFSPFVGFIFSYGEGRTPEARPPDSGHTSN